MRTARITFAVILLVGVVAAPAGAGDGPIIDSKSGGASSIEVAVVESIPSVPRSFADFNRPADATPVPVEWDGPRLDGVTAVTLAIGDGGFTALESVEQLTGPDDDYLTRIGFGVYNQGDVDYYRNRPLATLYIARFTGEPVAPDDDGLVGISLAFTWSGEQGLDDSPFPNDPMLGYAHSAEHGTDAGRAFDGFSSVEDGKWTRYSDPLLTMGGPIIRDTTWHVAWVVPGVPEKAAVTLSYAEGARRDPGDLFSQQIEFKTPRTLELPGLDLQYADLTPLQQEDLENQWVVAGSNIDDTPPTTVANDDEELPELPIEEPLSGGPWYEVYRVWLGVGIMLLLLAYIVAMRRDKGDDAPLLLLLNPPPQPEPEPADGPIPEDTEPTLGGTTDKVVPS